MSGDIPWNSNEDICGGHLKFKTHISADCRDLIRRCLSVDPQRRASLDDILAHRWLQGATRTLTSHDLNLRRRPLRGLRATRPEEQDYEIETLINSNRSASPPDAESLARLEAEKALQHLPPHTHDSLASGSSSNDDSLDTTTITTTTTPSSRKEKKQPDDDTDRDLMPPPSQVPRHTAASSSRTSTSTASSAAELAYIQSNDDLPLWLRQTFSAIIEDRNPRVLASAATPKEVGLYYQSAQPHAVGDIDCYEEFLARSCSNGDANAAVSTSNVAADRPSPACFPTNVTQPVYRRTQNSVVYPATVSFVTI